MRKTLALSLCIVLLCGSALCGCHPAPQKNDLQYSTAYPLSAAEYQMAVNQKLAPLISALQPLAKAESLNQKDLESAAAKIAEVSEKIAALNPPKDKVMYQAELLNELQAAANWLKAHYDDTAVTPDGDFSAILKSIEDAFHVSVN